jgi:hypothetical protein
MKNRAQKMRSLVLNLHRPPVRNFPCVTPEIDIGRAANLMLKRYGASEPSPARLAPTNPVAARAGPLPSAGGDRRRFSNKPMFCATNRHRPE